MQRILRRRDRGVHSREAPAHTQPGHPPAPPEPSPAGLAAGAGAATGAVPATAATAGDATPNGTNLHDAVAPPAGVDPSAAPAGIDPSAVPAGVNPAAAPAGIDPAAPTTGVGPAVPPAGIGPAAPKAGVDPVAAPAGVDPAATDAGPSFRERGRLRRRLRFLRRLRELGFRDLGGLVFDQHRFDRPDDELVRGKLTALAAVDAELRALERALRDRRPITELREPGISACARCGAVIASDARFCSACGVPVGGARAIPGVGGPAAAAPENAPVGAERITPPAPPPAAAAPPADEQPTVITWPGDRPSS